MHFLFLAAAKSKQADPGLTAQIECHRKTWLESLKLNCGAELSGSEMQLPDGTMCAPLSKVAKCFI
jgi:hypothetical protein